MKIKSAFLFSAVVALAVGILAQNAFGQCTTTPSAINSNFNGTPIAANNYIWFNSVIKVGGVNSRPVTIFYGGASVNFTVNGNPVNVNIPAAIIMFSPSATTASTSYDAGSDTWITVLPADYSGNVFLSGAAYQLPSNYPGGINPVIWSGEFSSDTVGISAQWQWASAVYTSFSNDPNAAGVKAVDDNKLNPPYLNSDHAGTPENFRSFVIGGTRGGGGSNFTGSYSGTASVKVGYCPPGGGKD